MGATSDTDLAERFVREYATRDPPRLITHEHMPGPTRLLEPRGDVQRVADEVGVTRGDYHFAGVHTNARGQRLAVPGGDLACEVLKSVLDLDPGTHGALGVVFGNRRDAERGHHPVAHEFRDGPAVRVDRILEQRVIAGQDLTRNLRVGALTEAGGAPKVGEEHRYRLANRAAIGRRIGRGRRCCRCDRGLVGNRGAALIAEP